MSLWVYSLQACVIGGLLTLLLKDRILRLQVLTWTVGVIVVAWRYDLIDQLTFYSNDQVHYTSIVRALWSGNWTMESSWWLDGAKIPYTLSALPLTFVGVHEALALKTISLVCLLRLSHLLTQRISFRNVYLEFRMLYFTGCGLIGSFFSLLALRETMMMLFTYTFATSKSSTTRLISLLIVGLLRPHLAIAIVLAESVIGVWYWVESRHRVGFGFSPMLVIFGAVVGNFLYTLRLRDLRGIDIPFFNDWGTREVTQIASNYFGLQFLTTESWNVSFSISDLLILRVVLSETLVIPTLFTIVMLVAGLQAKRLHRTTLLIFSIYISIATNTDFNSFRQNIPLMPLLGIAIIEFLDHRKQDVERRPAQQLVAK